MFRIAKTLIKPKNIQQKFIRQQFIQQKSLLSQQKLYFSDNNNKTGYKEAFEKMKEKIPTGKEDSEIKMEMLKEKMQGVKDTLNPSKFKENIETVKQKIQQRNEEIEKQKREVVHEQVDKEEEERQKQEQEVKKESFYEKISKKDDHFSKILTYGIDALRETFPNEQYIAQKKLEKIREEAKKRREEEEAKIEYTEEEIEKMQESIPDWKKTSLQTSGEIKTEKVTLSQKLKNQAKAKFNKTEFAQKLYETEEYKEYETAKVVMSEFKEDVKDRIHNSPSNVVQGSLYIYEKAKTENPTAKAIKMMRKYDPEFDIFQFEQETKVIFEQTFTKYLCHDLEFLEKVCGEQALGYFKVMIKKRETEKCIPKYKTLWTVDKPQFDKAYFPDALLPVFVFNIKVQEIHCNIDKKTMKIVDGADDRLMAYDYKYALRLHSEPDLEAVGHQYELVEIQPQQVVKMLV